MDFGICVPHYGRALEIGRILDVARRAEGLGFDSVWVTDHIIVPQSMDIIYRENMLDPLALLSHLAAVLTRARLGTSVLILPYRSPIVVAKMLATIDQLSQGRVIMGTGSGWMEEEFAALNANFKERGDFTDECLRIIRDFWTQKTVSIEGKFHRYHEMQTSPDPAQSGGPPIWVGGTVPAPGVGWRSWEMAGMPRGCWRRKWFPGLLTCASCGRTMIATGNQRCPAASRYHSRAFLRRVPPVPQGRRIARARSLALGAVSRRQSSSLERIRHWA